MPGTANLCQQICSRDNIKIITSIPYFSLSLSEQDYITVSFWCLPQRSSLSVRDFFFSDVLESLDSNGCNIPVLFYHDDFVQRFTSKRCPSPQKNALPTHLNVNVSQSPQLFFSCCIPSGVWHSIHLNRPPSYASLDRLFPSKLSRLFPLICSTLLNLVTRIKPILLLNSLLLLLAGV